MRELMSATRRFSVTAALLALLHGERDARAGGIDAPEGRVPPLLAPFVLPELGHSRLDVRSDWLLGGLAPTDPSRSTSTAAIVCPSVEAIVLAPRRLYVGGSFPLAAALPPDGGLAPGEIARPSGVRSMRGNVEAHVRAVFPLPMWLEIGFTLGVVAPTATNERDRPEHDRRDRSAIDAIASLDPTSYVHFLPGRIGLRPAGDLRILRGRLVFQGRHGFDVIIDGAGVDRARMASRVLGHVGYLLRDDVELSLEASQVYFFASDSISPSGPSAADRAFADKYRIHDERRAAFAFGPGLRLASREADVGLALVTNLEAPLSPSVSSFVGLRVSVIGHVGRSR